MEAFAIDAVVFVAHHWQAFAGGGLLAIAAAVVYLVRRK